MNYLIQSILKFNLGVFVFCIFFSIAFTQAPDDSIVPDVSASSAIGAESNASDVINATSNVVETVKSAISEPV